MGTDVGTVFGKPVGNNHQVLYNLILYVCLSFDDKTSEKPQNIKS